MRSNLMAIALAACAGCAFSAVAPQTSGRVRGVVVDERGAPIADVTVWSSPISGGVSGKDSVARSDRSGAFTIEHTGKTIRLLKDKYEPLVAVIDDRPSSNKYILKDAQDDFVLRPCGAVPARERAFGNAELRYTAATEGLKVLGGKGDVDYTEWVLRATGAKAGGLELWFGPTAMEMEPSDDELLAAEHFAMRQIVLENIGAVGVDTTGITGGKHWRQFAVAMQGARYKGATDGEAKMFDAVIDSACGSRPDQK